MSESGDYDPGVWSGYDFSAAKSTYDKHVGRSYDDALSSGKNISEILEKRLTTNSPSPLVIACDVTGSMGTWPATIFSKLPYLEIEGKEYLGKGMEISFAATGDAYSDKYPLQVRKFTDGKGLEKSLKELVIEGNGGGQMCESYDLTALYYARNVDMPNAVRPIMIMIGDEGLYEYIDKSHAKKYANINLEGRLSTKQVFEELKSKYSVYLVRKPYGDYRGDGMDGDNRKIYNQWVDLLGEDHIATLPDASRIVDVIFGILAKETTRFDYFKEELIGRQRPDQVKTVLKSLTEVYATNTGPQRKQLTEGSIKRSSDQERKKLL